MFKEAGFTFVYAVLAGCGLYLYEHALTHETCFSVLVAAWVTVSVLNHLSAQKKQQEPKDKAYATQHPRKFVAKRLLRAALLAVPLFLDVFTSSNDEVLSTQTGLRHEQLAEDSVRCGGASVGFIFVLILQRNILLANTSELRRFLFILAGMSMSVGPLLAIREADGRALAATTAALRILWMCLMSTHVISDVTDPVSTVHVLRVLSFGVIYSVAANVNSCLMCVFPIVSDRCCSLGTVHRFSGMGLGVLCWSLFQMQSPLLALSVLTLGAW